MLGLLQNHEDCYLGNEHDQACVFPISLFAAGTLGEDKFYSKVFFFEYMAFIFLIN